MMPGFRRAVLYRIAVAEDIVVQMESEIPKRNISFAH